VRQQIAAKISQIMPAHNHVVYHRERFRRLTIGNAVNDSDKRVGAGNPKRHLDVFFFYLCAGKTNYLIKT
jgi:hypothetical protein